MKIYVAGPFTTDSDGNFHSDPKRISENLRAAKEAGLKLAKMGHTPFIPHTHLGSFGEEISYDEIMRINLAFLRWADAILFLGPSKGANIELREAEKLGLKIFTSIEQIDKE